MIVSTTLAGPGAEASIVDALRSCSNLVDKHLILLSGCDVAAVKAAITASYYDGLRIVIWREYDWPNSYGEARTEALRWAESAGAAWALTVDCDERLDIDPDALRAALAVPGFDVICMVDRDIGYQKPRIIRCGVGAEWIGECHERLEAPGKRGLIGRNFWELPKSPEAELRRMRRGVDAMPRALAKEDLPQLRRHYGECLIGVGRQEEGFTELESVLAHPGATQFERSWCSYRLCERDVLRENFPAAAARAASALGEDPGFIQEFGWILAHCAAKRRSYHDAALWANYALAAPIDETRAGHRSPTWRAGCEDLLNRLEAGARAQVAREPIELPHGVTIPPFPTLSANMAEVMRVGRYEAREAYWLLTILGPSDRVLELGAGCGYLSTLAAKRLEPGAVLALEADPALVDACRATYAANGVDARVVHGAICGSPLGYLQRAPDFWSSRVESAAIGAIEVPGFKLAELAREHQPTVLVVDIEGGERHLLDERIPSTVRTILIETHSAELGEQIRDWSERQGFALEASEGNISVYRKT